MFLGKVQVESKSSSCRLPAVPPPQPPRTGLSTEGQMCHPQAYPSLDFSALHSSGTRNFPSKVMCLATSIILAVGKRIDNSTKQMEGNESQNSAHLTKEHTGSLPVPSHPREIEVFKLPTPSTGLSLYISARAGIQPPTNYPK